MDKIANGKYSVSRLYDGEKSKLGTINIKDDAISFDNTDDMHNIDLFKEGPMSSRSKDVFIKCLNKEHNHIIIEKK